MFSVSKSFKDEDGKEVLLHILVEERKMTFTRNVDGRLTEKIEFSPTEAEEVLNLFAIATENIVHGETHLI